MEIIMTLLTPLRSSERNHYLRNLAKATSDNFLFDFIVIVSNIFVACNTKLLLLYPTVMTFADQL